MPWEFPDLFMRTQALFDSWDCAPQVLPRRSRLYALEPVGIGTPFVESLSGYVARLADAHAVSVGDLVGRELSPAASKPLISFGRFMRQNRSNSHGFHAQAHAINGLGESSKRWIDALERATLRTGLRFLTLSPFDGVFSRQGASRDMRAWCSRCYDEWRSNGDVVYEPLLWTISLLKLCPRHLEPLVEECPHCRRPSMPLTVYSRPGHCSQCQEWLGSSTAASSPADGLGTAEASNTALWRAEAIGELLAIAPRLHDLSLHTVLTANLRACVDAVAEGHLDAFANECQVSRSALWHHLGGIHLPMIDTVLRICYRLGVPITTFLENDPRRADAHWKRARQAAQLDRMVPPFRSVERVHHVLVRAAQEHPVPSLSEIARRLGYKGTERLYHVDRDLCKKLAAMYRQSGRSHLWRKPGAARISEQVDLRQLLQQSFAQELPVSAHHIAARLGYANDGYLQGKFPDLCRAIRQKIAAKQVKRLVDMEMALQKALKEEPAPTLNDLRRRLGYSSSASLRLHFPGLCEQILARRRAVREQWIAEVKRAVQGLRLEVPAVSLRSASKRTGLSYAYLKELCPEECAALGSRYVRWRHEASQLRKAQLTEEVREIVSQLHDQSRCPTVVRVMSLLRPNTLREWKSLIATVKAAREAIEKEPRRKTISDGRTYVRRAMPRSGN